MVDPSTAAYVPVRDGHFETAIRREPGEPSKIRVRNSAPPHDELVVKARVFEERGVRCFAFEDGALGHEVTQPISSLNL